MHRLLLVLAALLVDQSLPFEEVVTTDRSRLTERVVTADQSHLVERVVTVERMAWSEEVKLRRLDRKDY